MESKFRDIFIQCLLMGQFTTMAEVNAQASIYKWNLDAGLAVIIVEQAKKSDPHNSLIRSDDVTDFVQAKLQSKYKLVIYTKIGEQNIFMAVPCNNAQFSSKQLYNTCLELAVEINHNFSSLPQIGIGRYYTSVLAASKSYREAAASIRIGREIKCKVCTKVKTRT